MLETVKPVTVDDVLAQALKLSAKERLQLLEKVAASVSEEWALPEPNPAAESAPSDKTAPQFVQREGETWGQALVRLVKELDMSDWTDIDIDDPVEWVKAVRKQEEDRLKAYWEGEK
jgi:hypothetical protein